MLKKQFFQYYIPSAFISSYFFLAFIFYAYNGLDQRFGYWDEFMELMIYSGVAFTLVVTYLRIKKVIPFK